MKTRKFRRADYPVQWLGGVCAGFAYCFGFPVWVARILFCLNFLFAPWSLGSFLVTAYVLLCIFLPQWNGNPEDFYEVTGD